MKSIITQLIILSFFLSFVCIKSIHAQCNPGAIQYTLKQGENENVNVIEVFMMSTKDYPVGIISTSTQIGFKMPSEIVWQDNNPNPFATPPSNEDLSIESVLGEWEFGNPFKDEDYSCGTPGYDYIYASLDEIGFFGLVADEEVLIFRFTLPTEVDCAVNNKATSLLEHNDGFVTDNCAGNNATNSITMSAESDGSCNNFLQHYDNGGVCFLSLLPVEYLHVKATAKQHKTYVEWATASEENNAGFEIQRSRTGDNWEKIGWVDGNGSTSERNDYILVDHRPFLGSNYYRLKQVDHNGKEEYSRICEVNFGDIDREIILFPNPVEEVLNIQLPIDLKGEVAIEVLDVGRRVVSSQMIKANGESVHFLEVENLTPGIYYMKIRSERFEEYHKFIRIGL